VKIPWPATKEDIRGVIKDQVEELTNAVTSTDDHNRVQAVFGFAQGSTGMISVLDKYLKPADRTNTQGKS
jgi:hypothetical protein